MRSPSNRLLTAVSGAIYRLLPSPLSSPLYDANLISIVRHCVMMSVPFTAKGRIPFGRLAAVTTLLTPPLVVLSLQPDADSDSPSADRENNSTAQWRVFTDMARDLVRSKKYEDAEKYLVRALDAARRGFGPRDPHVASACQNLAELYRLQKRYDEAGPLYEFALSILSEEFGTKDIRLAFALHNVAGFYFGQHNYVKAAQLYEQALEVKLASVGPGHTETANTLHHLAEVHWAQGHKKEAIAYATRSLNALVSQGVNEAACSKRRNRLATMLMDDGQAKEAICLLEKARLQQTEDDGIERAVVLEILARAQMKVGQADEARQLLLESIKLRRELSASWKLPDQKNMGNLAIASALCQLAESQIAFAATCTRPAEVSAAQLSALEAAREAVATTESIYAHYQRARDSSTTALDDLPSNRSVLSVTADWLKGLVKQKSSTRPILDGPLSQLNTMIRLDTALLELASSLVTLAELQLSLGSPTEAEKNVLRAWRLVDVEWNQHLQSFGSSQERERSRRLVEMHKQCACRILNILSRSVLVDKNKEVDTKTGRIRYVDVTEGMQRYGCR